MEFAFWSVQDDWSGQEDKTSRHGSRHLNASNKIKNTTETYCTLSYGYGSSERESKFISDIQYYGFYIIALFGCLCNLVLLIVLPLIKSTRNKPCGVFLWALTAADTLTLLSWRLNTLENDMYIQTGFAGCMTIGYIAHVSCTMSSLTTACATIFRFTAIVYPMKTRWSVNVNAARTGVAICAILSLVINIHSLCVLKPCGNSCTLDLKKGFVYLIVNTLVQIVISYVLVSLVVLVLSVAIVISLRRSTTRLKKLSNENVFHIRHKEEKQITVLLLTVVVTFIALRLPYLFTWIGKAIFREIYRNKDLTTHYHNVGRITGCCFMIAHAVNLWILLLSSRFRKDLSELLKGTARSESSYTFDMSQNNGVRKNQNDC